MVRVDIVFKHYNSQLQVLRGRVLRAFLQANVEPHWHEWDLRQKPLPPAIASQSPLTVLVNGVDVSQTGSSLLERFQRFIGFFDGGGLDMPSSARIASVLKAEVLGEHHSPPERGTFNPWLASAVFPLLLLSFFAGSLCVHCSHGITAWHAGALHANLKYMLMLVFPLVFFCVVLALGALLYRVRQRQGYKPLLLALIGTGLMFYSQLGVINTMLHASGVVLLLVAGLWNACVKSFQALNDCPRCSSSPQSHPSLQQAAHSHHRGRFVLNHVGH